MKKMSILTLGLISISLLMSQFVTNNYSVGNNSLKTSDNKIYSNGTAIYFNPEIGLKCTVEEYEVNLNTYVVSHYNDVTELKNGCMKWYTFNDNEDSTTVNMILDHNTTGAVNWNSSGDNTNGMGEVRESLENDTSTWLHNLNPRLIDAYEIVKITGNTAFTGEFRINQTNIFYFDSNSQTQVANEINKSNYSWLYDNTTNCIRYGCNVEIATGPEGYWTSTPVTNSSFAAWQVVNSGSLRIGEVRATYYSVDGVRPVITVNKSALSESVIEEEPVEKNNSEIIEEEFINENDIKVIDEIGVKNSNNAIMEEDQIENPNTGEKIIYIIAMSTLVILLIICIIVKLIKTRKRILE